MSKQSHLNDSLNRDKLNAMSQLTMEMKRVCALESMYQANLDASSRLRHIYGNHRDEMNSLINMSWDAIKSFKGGTNYKNEFDPNKTMLSKILSVATSYEYPVMQKNLPASTSNVDQAVKESEIDKRLIAQGLSISDLVDNQVKGLNEEFIEFLKTAGAYASIMHPEKYGNDDSFYEFSKSIRQDIRDAIYNMNVTKNINKSLSQAIDAVMNEFVEGFSLDVVTYADDKKIRYAIYQDEKAREAIESVQYALNQNVRSRGMETENLNQVGSIADNYRKQAESVNKGPNLFGKIPSWLKNKHGKSMAPQ